MIDMGFQNLSRLLASGKPIRVVVLDAQVYSNTGGQACTSGFLGQISDMAAYGKDQHGKEETRKELALLAMAHRNVYVLQSSQANASHLIGGVLKGLQSHYPSVFILHSPCPPEHGVGDDAATAAAKLTLESRAFPLMVYDPAEGTTLAERLSLDGNPSMQTTWPEYELSYKDADGNEASVILPITIADWAATEGRFRKHFTPAPEDDGDDDAVPFHEYLLMTPDERADKTPFIRVLDDDQRLGRLAVSQEIVALAEDRLEVWSLLRQLAGLEATDEVRGLVEGELDEEYEGKLTALRAEYEAQLSELKSSYPRVIARRMAEGLIRAGNGQRTVADLLKEIDAMPNLAPIHFDNSDATAVSTAPPPSSPAAPAVMAAPAVTTVADEEEDEEDEEIALGPYIDTARCTTCDECTNINNRMFAYDDKKQAYIKDPRVGTFKELVQAAEKCPVEIIHPGTPLNPKEKGLEKWVKRAEPFN